MTTPSPIEPATVRNAVRTCASSDLAQPLTWHWRTPAPHAPRNDRKTTTYVPRWG